MTQSSRPSLRVIPALLTTPGEPFSTSVPTIQDPESVCTFASMYPRLVSSLKLCSTEHTFPQTHISSASLTRGPVVHISHVVHHVWKGSLLHVGNWSSNSSSYGGLWGIYDMGCNRTPLDQPASVWGRTEV